MSRRHLALAPVPGAAGRSRSRACRPPTRRRELGPLPRPLGFADIVRYRQVFALQREADWAGADRLIEELDDELLRGHVLAATSPTRPATAPATSRTRGLALERYADLPQAVQIHRMALAAAARARQPVAPVSAGAGTTARS